MSYDIPEEIMTRILSDIIDPWTDWQALKLDNLSLDDVVAISFDPDPWEDFDDEKYDVINFLAAGQRLLFETDDWGTSQWHSRLSTRITLRDYFGESLIRKSVYGPDTQLFKRVMDTVRLRRI